MIDAATHSLVADLSGSNPTAISPPNTLLIGGGSGCIPPTNSLVSLLQPDLLLSTSMETTPIGAFPSSTPFAITPAFVRPFGTSRQEPMGLFQPQSLPSELFFKHDRETPFLVDTDDSTTASISEHASEKSLQKVLNVDTMDSAMVHHPRALVVGHRGAIYEELENTRQSFQRCANLGCDAVELDVFLLKDGSLIVFHGGGTDESPGDLLDYCGRPGSILDLTLEECKALTFNPSYDEFPCPKKSIEHGSIPTLEQVLLDVKASGTGMNVKIELKGPGTVEPVLDLVERLDMVHQCQFSSFDHDRLALLRTLRPQVDDNGVHVYKTGALFDNIPDNYIDIAKDIGATEIHLRYDTCTPRIISDIHNAGFGSMVWMRGPIGMSYDTLQKYWDVGNEDESMYDTILRTGVQQVCVNRPDVLVAMQKRKAVLQSN